MAKQPKYLKIGNPKAHTFYCPITGVNISNKQVIRLHDGNDINKPSLQDAIRTRHLAEATQEEYDAYQGVKKKLEAAMPKVHKVVTETKTVIGSQSEPPDNQEEGDDEDLGDDDGHEEETGDDDEEPLSKSELIDLLKESAVIDEEKKKKLTKMSQEKLQSLWSTVKPKDNE